MSHCGHIKSIDQDLLLATAIDGAILAIGCTRIPHSFKDSQPNHSARIQILI
jgi:hypothetical protein